MFPEVILVSELLYSDRYGGTSVDLPIFITHLMVGRDQTRSWSSAKRMALWRELTPNLL